MHRKTVCVIALALLMMASVAGIVSAQEMGRIDGRVTREDGSGIQGVSVRIDQLDQVVF